MQAKIPSEGAKKKDSKSRPSQLIYKNFLPKIRHINRTPFNNYIKAIKTMVF